LFPARRSTPEIRSVSEQKLQEIMQALQGQMKQSSLLSHEAAGELSFFKQALQSRIGRKFKPIVDEEI